MRCGTDGLSGARNKVAQRVIDNGADWLFWLDSDMGFEPDTLSRLMEIANPVDRPIVSALCFAQREVDRDGMSGFVTRAGPTIMDWRDNEKGAGFVGRAWFPANTLVECNGTGSACILIHRSVLEQVNEKFGPIWYDKVKSPGGFIAEDLSFCARATMCNNPIFVHTGVRTTHMKTVWLGEKEWWEQQVAPPADVQVGVLVPVLGRPQNAEPFMKSLRASTGLATAYAIHDDRDVQSRDAWKAAGAVTLSSPETPFACKINRAFDQTSEPWVFLAGDDVKFFPGWLDHALFASRLSGAQVVGTNDLHNPRVTRGEHATHLLIGREYVDEHGGSWDGPGVVCHAGYQHWFVDDEIVAVAKARNVFTVALASKVEHLHPLWDLAEDDSTYQLGQKSAEIDHKLFRKRSHDFGRF
jgi:hypothetical protein